MPKVVREDIDNLNTVVTVTLEKSDYEPKLNSELNKYRKQAQMKGFRRGRTPMSVVRKMYGKSVLAEVINGMLQEEMRTFLSKDGFNYLGQPIPSDEQDQLDFDIKNLEDYVFKFDLGLAPDFEVQGLDKDNEFSQYVVEISDEQVAEQVENIRSRMGERLMVEDAIEDGDSVKFSVVEMEDDAPKAAGIEAEFSIPTDRMTEGLKSQVIGLKAGDSISVNPFEMEGEVDEDYVKKYILQLEEDHSGDISDTFQASIVEVSRMKKPEIDQAFFDKYYGEGEVADEAAFREKLRADIADSYKQQTEALLFRDVQEDLLNKNELTLPDPFLKRWIQLNNEGLTEAQIEEEYDGFAKNLTWSLIRSKIAKAHDLEVKEAEILSHFENQIMGYFGGNAMGQEEMIRNMAQRFMNEEKQVNQAYEAILTEKLFKVLEEQVSVTPNPISAEAFEEVVRKINEEAEQQNALAASSEEE